MEFALSILFTEQERYTPTVGIAPDDLDGAICEFFWRREWNPSPALIQQETEQIRSEQPAPQMPKTRRRRRNDDDPDRVTQQKERRVLTEEFAEAVIRQACDDLADCIDWFAADRAVKGLLSVDRQAGRAAIRHTNDHVRAAVHAFGWLLADGTRTEEAMGLSFNECVQLAGCDPHHFRKILFKTFKFPRTMVLAMLRYTETLEDEGLDLCVL